MFQFVHKNHYKKNRRRLKDLNYKIVSPCNILSVFLVIRIKMYNNPVKQENTGLSRVLKTLPWGRRGLLLISNSSKTYSSHLNKFAASLGLLSKADNTRAIFSVVASLTGSLWRMKSSLGTSPIRCISSAFLCISLKHVKDFQSPFAMCAIL